MRCHVATIFRYTNYYDLPNPNSYTDILKTVTGYFCPPSLPASIPGHWNRRMSCQAAVNLISGLQNMADPDHVRDLLHYEDPEDCHIEISDAFQ